jgi:spectinomycin phosphotransferase
LEFVVACLPARSGRFTVPFAHGALSATPWAPDPRAGDGGFPHRALAETSAGQLSRLHGATPPDCLPVWQPLVPADFAATLATRVRTPWVSGPFGERARSALHRHLDDVLRWTAAYHRLAEDARARPWVPTHGEPHTRNLLLTATGPVLVDWESLKLAPRERDLRPLVASGHADLVQPHGPMLEMFDLEWRLDEISQYSDWFEAAHTGNESDEVALGGLISELARPEWSADRGAHG